MKYRFFAMWAVSRLDGLREVFLHLSHRNCSLWTAVGNLRTTANWRSKRKALSADQSFSVLVTDPAL